MLRATGVATVIMALPYPGMAHASNWQTAVALPMTVEHDSNPRLDTSGVKAVTRTIIAPDYNLVGTYGRDQFKFGLGVSVEHSSDTSVIKDREDPNLQLGWQRETEKGSYGLAARYVESSTLSSVVEKTGVVVATDGTQKLYSLAGNWSSALSERSTLSNETGYTSVHYDINSLINYNELSNRLVWRYAWSERAEPFLRFDVTRYEPEKGFAVASSNSYTPTAGVKYQFSERLEGTVHAGVNQVSGTNGGSSGQGGVEVRYRGARVDSSLDVSRSSVASGQGGFAEIDQVQGRWSYAVDEISRLGVDASWQDSKGQTPNTLRKYDAWFSRELSPFWIVRLSLMYKERQQDGLPDASGEVFGLTLAYSHPDF